MKKTKLITSICVPAAALSLAGGITGLVLALNKNHDVNPDVPTPAETKTVKFLPGEGSLMGRTFAKVAKGTTLDKIAQPEAIANGKLFAGWTLENGKKVTGRAVVNDNMVLKATYSSTLGDHSTISFVKKSDEVTGVTIQGNTKVAVKNKDKFFMVNRPSAKKKIGNVEYEFAGWKYLETYGTHTKDTLVGENDEITQDIKIYPSFVQTVTLTFQGGTGTTRVHGTETVNVATTKQFQDINTPTYTHGSDYLIGWKDSQGNDVGPTTTFSANTTLIAQWTNEPSSLYVGINYKSVTGTKSPDGTSAKDLAIKLNGIASGGAVPTYALSRQKAWKDANRPLLTSVNEGTDTTEKVQDYYIKGWEYIVTGSGSTNWTALTDTTTFEASITAIDVRPVLWYAGSSVSLTADKTTVAQGQKTNLYAYVLGGSDPSKEIDQDVVWTSPSDDITISATGELSVADKCTTGSYTIKATNKYTWKTDETAIEEYTISINVVTPYADSKTVWVYNKMDSEEAATWKTIDMRTACDPTATSIKFYIGGDTTAAKTKTAARTTFNDTLYFGGECDVIYEGFLAGCSAFNNGFTTGTAIPLALPSTLKAIRPGFLENCTAFNQPITFNSGLTTIDDSFLAGCTSFDQAIAIPATVTNIGNHFMFGCTTFGTTGTLTFTDTPTIKTIGTHFLCGCSAFNQSLTIPASVTEIGQYFMNLCSAFTSTLTINTTTNVLVENEHNLSDNVHNTAISTTGFTLAGTQTVVDELLDTYPTITGTSTEAPYVYRKITNSPKTAVLTKQATTPVTYTTTDTVLSGLAVAQRATYKMTVTDGKYLTSGQIVYDTQVTPTGNISVDSIKANGVALTSGTDYELDGTTAGTLKITFKSTNKAVGEVTVNVRVNAACNGGAATFSEVEVPGFNGLEWSTITGAVTTFESSAQDETATLQFLNTVDPNGNEHTWDTDAKTTLEKYLVGKTGKITINGKLHTIRCIGCLHDAIVESGTVTNKKATLTYELTTLLSGDDGNALTTIWSGTGGVYNYDYTNSALRANLTGEGTASRKTWSATALSMLPSDISTAVKTVEKKVATSDGTGQTPTYAATTYQDKLFPITYTEMGQTGSIAEGTAYKYWTTHSADNDRIKKDANASAKVYWLGSPNTSDKQYAWGVTAAGTFESGYNVSDQSFKRSVSFAFCI